MHQSNHLVRYRRRTSAWSPGEARTVLNSARPSGSRQSRTLCLPRPTSGVTVRLEWHEASRARSVRERPRWTMDHRSPRGLVAVLCRPRHACCPSFGGHQLVNEGIGRHCVRKRRYLLLRAGEQHAVECGAVLGRRRLEPSVIVVASIERVPDEYFRFLWHTDTVVASPFLAPGLTLRAGDAELST